MLSIDYLKKPGVLELLDGEEIKEINPNGEYFSKSEKIAKKAFFVFTNKRFMTVVENTEHHLFKKKEPLRYIAIITYTNIAVLKRAKVSSDDSFCTAIMKDGGDYTFNLFGEVFGPLTRKFIDYSGIEIERDFAH